MNSINEERDNASYTQENNNKALLSLNLETIQDNARMQFYGRANEAINLSQDHYGNYVGTMMPSTLEGQES